MCHPHSYRCDTRHHQHHCEQTDGKYARNLHAEQNDPAAAQLHAEQDDHARRIVAVRRGRGRSLRGQQVRAFLLGLSYTQTPERELGKGRRLTEPTEQEISRLCDLVRDLPADQRGSVLDRECRGAAGLKERVLAMIATEQGAGPEVSPVVRDRAEAATTAIAGPRGSPTVPGDRPRFEHGRFDPGRILGDRFRIISLLGKGGMGEVYRADDLELGQPVAIKLVVNRTDGRESWTRRLRSEVRTAQQVTHANVCRVHDIGEADGQTFLFMEYVDGDDLSSVLRRLGKPDREKAFEIARQICLGLAAAHEKGVLHRDLKHANIMIDGRGRVRITDFGLAGFFDEFDGFEAIAGTPAYMAPEQLAGGAVSVRSDIYSLGLVLYELFTGKHAFETDDIEALKRAHSIGSIALPSSVAKDVEPALERVIMHCLQRRPEQRPQSVDQVLAALPYGVSRRESKVAGIVTKLCECRDRAALVRRRAIWAVLAAVCVPASIFILLGSLGMALSPNPPGKDPTIGWVMAGMSLIPLVLGLGFAVLAFAQRLAKHRCQRCGYDVRGIADRCPECGLLLSGSP